MNRLRSLNLDVLRRPRVLIAIGVVIAIVIGFYVGWWSPESSKLSSVVAQQNTNKTKITALTDELNRLKATNRVAARYKSYLPFFAAEIPALPEQGQLVYLIGQLEKADGVFVTSIDVSTTALPVPPSTLSTIPISLSLTGPHDDVIKFLTSLTDFTTMPRLITIQSIAPSPTGAPAGVYNILGHDTVGFSLSISATAYFAAPIAATP
ncbi:MAG: type 4a pilus biogenesis protein PilO [Acidimicrobiales bacterium]